MIADYYAILGVRPGSSRADIRAAYVRLMRCYHPDRNSSVSAARRVREINAAYGALGDADRRAQYDQRLFGQPRVRPAPPPPVRPVRRIFAPRTFPPLPSWAGVAAAAAFLLVLVPLLIPPLTPRDISQSAASIGYQRSAAAAPQQTASATDAQPDDLCSSSATTQELERQLLGRAARLLGARDRGDFARLPNSLRLRFRGPERTFISPNATSVSCVAAVAMEFLPGIPASDLHPGLIGTIGYTLVQSENGAKSIRLDDGDQLIRFLASLARPTAHAESAFVPNPIEPPAMVEPPEIVTAPKIVAYQAPPAPRPKRPADRAEPSFNCNSARTFATASVCKSASLASLDRQLASAWGDTMARATAPQRAMLLRNDRQFIARRDACSSEACVRAAYTAQIGAIGSISAARNP